MTDYEKSALSLMFEKIARTKTGIRISVVFNPAISTACTNGNCITINPGTSQVFKNVPEDKTELFIAGLFGHELMHCIKTPFDEVKALSEGKYQKCAAKFRKILNVLEDPAIENFASWFEGGFLAEGIKYVNEMLYNDSPEIESIDYGNGMEDLTAYAQWETAMLYYGWTRQIKNNFTSDKAKKAFYDNFNLYEEIINEADNHKRLMLQVDFFERIRALFGDRINNESPEEMGYGPSCNMQGGQTDEQLSQAAQQFRQTQMNESGNSDESDTQQPCTDSGQKPNSDTSDKSDSSESNSGGSGGSNKGDSENNAGEKSEDNKEAEKEVAIKTAIKNMNAQLKEAKKKLQKEIKENKKAYENAKVITPTNSDIARYASQKKVHNPYIKQLSSSWKRLLTPELKGKIFSSGGNFNIDRYACKGHQTVNFFEKKKLPQEVFDAAVCILFDVSGSMDYEMNNAMSQLQVLVESFEYIGVDSCVIPFSDDLYVLKKWGQKLNCWYNEADGTTATDRAAILALNTIKYRNARNKMCIIITDGSPDYYEDTRIAIEELSKVCDVYTVLIGAPDWCISDPEYIEYFRNLFGDNFCTSKDVSSLNKVLTPKIRKSLRKWM